MENHLRPGDDGYDQMYAYWRRDEGVRFVYQGATWYAIRDNEVIVFHRTGSMSELDGAYEDYSFTND